MVSKLQNQIMLLTNELEDEINKHSKTQQEKRDSILKNIELQKILEKSQKQPSRSEEVGGNGFFENKQNPRGSQTNFSQF